MKTDENVLKQTCTSKIGRKRKKRTKTDENVQIRLKTDENVYKRMKMDKNRRKRLTRDEYVKNEGKRMHEKKT